MPAKIKFIFLPILIVGLSVQVLLAQNIRLELRGIQKDSFLKIIVNFISTKIKMKNINPFKARKDN